MEKNQKDQKILNSQHKSLDDVLSESVGKFGIFQAWILFICFFCQATFAPAIYGSVFTDFTPKHHCAEDQHEVFNFSRWENETSRCEFARDENMTMTKCSSWVYDKSVIYESVSADFDIVCDKAFLKTLSGTLRMSGLLIGSFIFGWLSDGIGRVPSLTLAGLTVFTSELLAGFSTNYLMFSILNVFMAAGGVDDKFMFGFLMLTDHFPFVIVYGVQIIFFFLFWGVILNLFEPCVRLV